MGIKDNFIFMHDNDPKHIAQYENVNLPNMYGFIFL